MVGTVGHEGQLVHRVKQDQAAGGRHFVQHLRPSLVGRDALDEILPQRQGVEPTVLIEGKQGEAVYDLTR
jgi:hypothetical protein